ncbi:hypothetical protein K440DRAFT_405676 [Wilcoxina mikolae CBS 423.85]|nr:hypothetical protein K440DRAFT_405676 [Wilcoxina mikolae CBS 423.85]
MSSKAPQLSSRRRDTVHSSDRVAKPSSTTEQPRSPSHPKTDNWTCSRCKTTTKSSDRVSHLCFVRDYRYHCHFCDAFFHESQNQIHISEPLHIRNAANRPEGRRPKVRGSMSDAAYAELCRDPRSDDDGSVAWLMRELHEEALQEDYLSSQPTEEEDPEYWFWRWKHGNDGEGVGVDKPAVVEQTQEKSQHWTDDEFDDDDFGEEDDNDYDNYGDDNDYEDWTCGSPNY